MMREKKNFRRNAIDFITNIDLMMLEKRYKNGSKTVNVCLRPYHVEYTSSRPITEVKQRRARLVLGWVTAWEYRVS